MSKKREYDVEPIHDDDLLYRRFHPASLRLDGNIDYSAFTKHDSGEPDPEISVDLARKTTPEKTLAAVPRRLVNVLGLGVLKAGDVRRLGFTVRHDPKQSNRAHSLIEGVKTEADCYLLAEITQVHTLPPSKSRT
jgi:hypothetical protein